MIRRWAKYRWKLKGSVDILAIPGGLFLFKFNVEEDPIFVLSGSWAYGKHFLTLAKWKPDFDPSTELNRMAPVWVRLPGLSLEFWDEQIFRWIGNSFDSYVVADSVTLNKSRLVYVRFCVNVVINKALPNFVSLKSKWGKWSQAIVYENATLFCQKCNKQGHTYTKCKNPVSVEPKLKEKTILGEPINLSAPSSSAPLGLPNVNEVPDDYPHTNMILEILKSPMVSEKIVNLATSLEEDEIPPLMSLYLSPNPLPPPGLPSEKISPMLSTIPIPPTHQASISDEAMSVTDNHNPPFFP
ncbi:uncharacterized protein LOC131875098 [Cryptomeria japonica]|uniref:uncharacterized protein LOC131875098 n=1 Tax=Cryptomeria japonica TaxID=3369 RepID=UPI0027DA6E38|nr:uncharacterized protein LOC131875098 [Cryptomeria japonica]